jgi:hypothetical protein
MDSRTPFPFILAYTKGLKSRILFLTGLIVAWSHVHNQNRFAANAFCHGIFSSPYTISLFIFPGT